MQQSNIVLGLLAPANQNATETVHPTVCPLHYPTPSPITGLPLHFLRFLLFGRDVGGETEFLGDLLYFVISVAQIQAQPLRLLGRWLGPLDRDAFQGFFDHLHVGSVGAVHGQSDRDTLALDQQAAFGALLGAVGGIFPGFFPPRGVPWSYTRPSPAKTNRSPSSRRRPSDRPPTWLGRRLLSPSVGSGRGRSSRGRSMWRSGLSTGSRCVRRTGWLPCRRDRGWAVCRRRRDAYCGVGGSTRRWPAKGHRECSTGLLPVVVPLQGLRHLLSCQESSAAAPRSYRRSRVIRIGSNP
jgi:hypothetical protein